MSVSDIIILTALSAAVIAAVAVIINRRRKGKCSCGCENCAYKCKKRQINEKVKRRF